MPQTPKYFYFTSLFHSLIPLSSTLSPPQISQIPPFSSLVPMTSVSSQDVLPPHPTMCPVTGTDPSQSERWRPPPNES